ncbi:tRNA (5-methylaminomethyl-2-thiouridine)(34)-methyltransferase MnmD [Paludibacter sp.]
MSSKIIITEDGSHSMLQQELNETFHSVHGAIQESNHTFIVSGLNNVVQNKSDVLNILEIGFGTGLNAFLSLLFATEKDLKIRYTAIELFPLSVESACLLNYPDILKPAKKDEFYKMHTSPWNNSIKVTPNFELLKINADFTKINLSGYYDLVYFDAFSPEKQPEMWTDDRFSMLYSQCNSGAILTTYCAKGSVRRALQAAGFYVERIPGAPGKREMLRARKR